MFGTLKNILTEEWQNNTDNFSILLITEITTNFGTDNKFKEFIDVIKSRSVKDFNVNVSIEDHILTLSTCADNNKYRVVLHAKKITE